MQPQPLPTVCAEEASILSWQTFLTSYSRGSFPNSSYPPIPLSSPRNSISADPLARPVISDPETLYPTQAISASIARNVRNFSIDQGYLPPPRSADEVLREQCIQEYELEGAHQRANVQSAVDVLAAIFPETVCTFTIFRGAKQSFIAVAGDQGIRDELGLYTDFEVRSDLGFCGHCVLLKENVMFVPSLQKDWRFANNPYSQAGLKSYIGVPITLELDRLSSDSDDGVPQRVSIGALNILYRKDYLPELTATSKMVVTNISRMLETQLRATWDGNRRTVEAKYRLAVAEMIQDAFVGELESVEDDRRAGLQDLGALAQHAAEKLVNLLPQLDSVTVIDTKSLIASISSPTALDDPSITLSYLLGQASKSSSSSSSLPPPGSIAALYQIPNHQRRTVFSPLHRSGLEPFLPSQCSTHVAMPFSTRAHPSFLILCTSQSLSLSSTTINIIRNIGALLLARATQDLVIEADAAKTVFLSSISHELRTPLHSIMAAIDLTHDYLSVNGSRSASAGGREQLLELLDAIRSSSAALQGTLNDVLEFGKPPTRQISPHDTLSASTSVHLDTLSDRRGSVSTQSSRSNGSVGQGPHLTVNVVKCIKDAVQICLLQDGNARDREIAFEHEDRDWSLRMDEAKLRRIITNGLSNALKFCLSAPIGISLICNKAESSRFELVITDHGPGIDAALVPRLMEAFTKQDVNTPGIGLGLHITSRLVDDMGGKLRIVPVAEPETGTHFVVELPRVCVETQDREQNGEGSNGVGLIHEKIRLPTFAKPSRPASPPYSDGQAVFDEPYTAERRPSIIPRDSELEEIKKNAESTPTLSVAFVDLKVSVPPPIASPTAKAIDQLGPSEHDAPQGRSHEALRVMVIDDNTICRRLLSAFVTKTLRAIHTPYSKPVVKQYPDALSAIADFLTVKPHLILTDVSMPGMDGVTAAAEMRALGASIRPIQEGDGGDDRKWKESASGSGSGSEIWGRDNCYIYAITGLGSSDPRLKASGMLGSAALDGWLVKGKDDMKRIEEILKESEARLRV